MKKSVMAVAGLVVAGGLSCSALAMAAGNFPAGQFDPSGLKGPAQGPANEVFVLGTAHLSGLPATFQNKSLNLVLDKLAAWKPQVIAIEALSGAQCDYMRHYPARYADTVKSFCPSTETAKAATGRDVPAATAEMESLLAALPAQPSAAQRRQLAAVMLAAGEPASALVQWLHLPETERKEDGILNQKLVDMLNRITQRRDESFQIAVPLAVKMGLQRVYAVDDHTADLAFDAAEEKAAGDAIQGAWNNPASAARKEQDKALYAKLGSSEGVLDMYLAYNEPAAAELIFKGDFGANMNEPSAKHYGRMYLGYWETRNLRMVSNIRDVMGIAPGKRTLAIVGASHKPYYEAYLHMMHDVKVHFGNAVLKANTGADTAKAK
ncbi:DUF5694 domain-containing protein [Undibacterium squillarum]|uniref:DUF5694 domain-containing protein n=1 Tax=Undibacterium squillarum TaxID=1131567 RepID=UPI0035AFD5AF